PDEEGETRDEARERDPEVQAHAADVARGVDSERLLVHAKRRVPDDVEREERRPAELEAPVDPEQHEHAEDVPEKLVEEGRVIGVLRAFAVDLEAPRQRRVLAVELLVPPVSPATDSLGEQEAGRDGVHEEPHAISGTPDDPRAGEHPERDRAPDPE